MSISDDVTEVATATPTTPVTNNRPPLSKRIARSLSVRRIGAVYVLILISIIFSFWAPTLFPRWATVLQIVNSHAIGALAAFPQSSLLAAFHGRF